MKESVPDGKGNEPKLIKLYMELTGAGESEARDVFMHVCESDEGKANRPRSTADAQPLPDGESGEPKPPSPVSPVVIALAALGWGLQTVLGAPETNALPAKTPAGQAVHNAAASPDLDAAQVFAQPLSLADAINLALQHSANVLRAQKALAAAEGVVVQTRAVALPTVNIAGNYSTAQNSDVDIVYAPGLTFGAAQNWSSQVKLIQGLYEGGRILSSFRVARLTREQSLLNYQTALADTVLAVQLAYDDVLLAIQQITVQEASVELLTRELADTTRRFDAGTVPRFNVLRAEVELANARPPLIRARNSLRIAKNNLVNQLGFNVPREMFADIPLTLSGRLEAEPLELELPRALNFALERRSELGALRKVQGLRKEEVVNAKAGSKPVLQGYVGYEVHNSILDQDLNADLHGWIAGAQLSWNIWDGLRTQGRVKEATANYERAGVDLDDRERGIELEVRTAHSNFMEAREVLESQKKVVEEGEEALRLARARSEAGTGTQLDVLSAQTALTEARTTEIQALHDYAAARARLQRAVGMNVPGQEMSKP